MVSQEWTHDPQAKLDYNIDWSRWLEGTDTISASTWTIPTGLTQASPAPSISVDGKTTTVWISGGTAGAIYTVTNHVTTAAGREDDRSFALRVADR